MYCKTGFCRLAGIAMLAVTLPFSAHAATILTTGAGSAVTSAHRTATFDILGSGLPGEPTTLLGYTEDQIIVSVDDTPWTTGAFNGVHYGISGNNSFVTIQAADGIDMFSVEAVVFSGHQLGGTLIWRALKDGMLKGSGSVAGIDPYTNVTNEVFGWSDSQGFDELQLEVFNSSAAAFGATNVIALDNVRLQALSVPAPAPLPLLLSALVGLGLCGRKRKRSIV